MAHSCCGTEYEPATPWLNVAVIIMDAPTAAGLICGCRGVDVRGRGGGGGGGGDSCSAFRRAAKLGFTATSSASIAASRLRRSALRPYLAARTGSPYLRQDCNSAGDATLLGNSARTLAAAASSM